MFTTVTYQDWLKIKGDPAAVRETVFKYKASADFTYALTADRYFSGDNEEVSEKVIASMDAFEDERGKVLARDVELTGCRVSSNFFFRFVTQQNQHLLGNGLTISGDKKKENKKKLGTSFDSELQQIAENALIQEVCYGFWNLDHLEALKAAVDSGSGFCPLLDEETSSVRAGIQFWQIASDKPVYYRLFEEDGYTRYTWDGKENAKVVETQAKKAYKVTVQRDATGEKEIGADNYGSLPIFPMYGNTMKTSELTVNIKSKIDLYDYIFSDFGDDLEKATSIYWVLQNFGGNRDDVLMMLAEIKRLKATYAGDGASAEPHSFEVPYAARQTALELLEKALYKDYMAVNTEELTGGSLTNVAIRVAMTNLNLKADRFEWCVRKFCDAVFEIAQIKEDSYSFKRGDISNYSEIVQDIYIARQDLTQKKALELNPYIEDDEIDQLITDLEAETVSGQPSVADLQAEIERMRTEAANGQNNENPDGGAV